MTEARPREPGQARGQRRKVASTNARASPRFPPVDWFDLEAAAFPDDYHRGREEHARLYARIGFLRCIECSVKSRAGARGWRAETAVNEDEPDEVAIYCPDCWELEFGPG